jgi:hypothetical protein
MRFSALSFTELRNLLARDVSSAFSSSVKIDRPCCEGWTLAIVPLIGFASTSNLKDEPWRRDRFTDTNRSGEEQQIANAASVLECCCPTAFQLKKAAKGAGFRLRKILYRPNGVEYGTEIWDLS